MKYFYLMIALCWVGIGFLAINEDNGPAAYNAFCCAWFCIVVAITQVKLTEQQRINNLNREYHLKMWYDLKNNKA